MFSFKILPIITVLFYLALNTGCDQSDMYEFAKNGVIGPDEKIFTSFTLAGTKGSINNSTFTINVSLPVGTNVTALVPYFAIRGEHVEVVAGTTLISGTQAFDFSGTITFTVYAKNGTFQDYEASITFVTVPVTGVVLDTGSIIMDHNATSNLTATVYPTNATNQGVTWTTSNSSVATVSGGTINGVYPGTAIITVTTDDGSFTDTCTVEVVKVLQYIYATPASISLTVGTATTVTIAGFYSDSTLEPIISDMSFIVDPIIDPVFMTVTPSGSMLTITAGSTAGDGFVYVNHTRSGFSYPCTINVEILN